jgi:hypothetical protein
VRDMPPTMLDTVAVAQEFDSLGNHTGKYLIVKRTIDRITGGFKDVPVKGEEVYGSEGLADQRARALAVEIGEAKAKPKKDKQRKEANNTLRRQIRSQRDRDILAKFIGKGE